MTSSYKERFEFISNSLTDPNNNLNIDALLDSVSALVYEANVRSTNNQKNYETLVRKFLPSVKLIESQRVNITDFTILKVLGRGAFGEVSLVRHIPSKSIYALKSLNKMEMNKRGDAACLWEERDIMALSNSDWIVKLYYAFQDSVYLYMVMEFMQGGDMVNFMSTYEPDEHQAKFYIAELCIALNTLHELGYIHRDIKPDNMLIDSKGHLKICDFGTCIKMNNKGKVTANIAVGTPDYISPEILNSQNNETTYGKECDWWSVGVFIYEFVVGETPFYSDSLRETYHKILTHQTSLVFPSHNHLSEEIIDLIRKFITDANKRYGNNGLNDIKSHPYFKGASWTWDNIRNTSPPVIPEFTDLEDTSNFDAISLRDANESSKNISNYPFSGHHLAYIGFSFTGCSQFFNKNTSQPECKVKLINEKEDLENIKIKLADAMLISSQLESDKKQLRDYVKELKQKLENEIKDRSMLQQKIDLLNTDLSISLKESNSVINEQSIKISELEQKIRNYIFEINLNSNYKDENIKLTNKLKIAENELKEQIDNSKNMETQLKTIKLSEIEAKELYSNIKLEYENIKKIYNENKARINEIETINTNLNTELNSLKLLYSTLTNEYSQLKSQNTLLINDFDSIKILFGSTNTIQLKSKLIALKDNSVLLQNQLSQYELEIKKYEKQIEESPKLGDYEYVTLQSRYNIVINERDSLKLQTIEYDNRQRVLSEQYQNVSQQLNTLTDENVSKSSQIQDLVAKLNTASILEANFIREREELFKMQHTLENTVERLNESCLKNDKKIVELHEQLDSQANYYKMHKTQIEDAKEDLKELEVEIKTIKNNNSNLSQYNQELKSTILCKDRNIAEIQSNNMELKAQIELLQKNIKDLNNNNNNTTQTTTLIAQLKLLEEQNSILESNLKNKESEIDDYSRTITKLNEEINTVKLDLNSIQVQHKKSLDQERLLKEEAIKKLSDIMNMKTFPSRASDRADQTNKNSTAKKFERLNKQLQLQLKQEQDKYEKIIKDNEKRIMELKENILELNTFIDSNKNISENTSKKEDPSSIVTADSGSKTSTALTTDSTFTNTIMDTSEQLIKESFLMIQSKNKKTSRKINWQKTIVVLTNKAFSLYKDDDSKNKSISITSIDLRLIFHVRSVSQNDLIHVDANDIVKIFQLIYCEDIPSEESNCNEETSKEKCLVISNHSFINIQYHMPTTCDVCGKGLWGFIKSSQAYECRNCRFRCHKEHISVDNIPLCKAYDEKHSAKEIVLMCSSQKEQNNWINLLTKLLNLRGRDCNPGYGMKPYPLSSPDKPKQRITSNAVQLQSSISEKLSKKQKLSMMEKSMTVTHTDLSINKQYSIDESIIEKDKLYLSPKAAFSDRGKSPIADEGLTGVPSDTNSSKQN